MIPQHPSASADPAVSTAAEQGGDGVAVPTEPSPPEPGAAELTSGAARRQINRGLVLSCLALFLLSVLLAAVAAVQSSRLHRERADRRDVTSVAGRFATALLTYDYRNLPAAKARVLALSVGKFRQEYEQAYSGGLDVLITQTKAISQVTVTHLYVGEIAAGHAEAVIVVNQTSTGTTGTHPAIDQYVQLDLVRVSGEWKVDNVTNLTDTQPRQSSPPTPSTSTTATTASR